MISGFLPPIDTWGWYSNTSNVDVTVPPTPHREEFGNFDAAAMQTDSDHPREPDTPPFPHANYLTPPHSPSDMNFAFVDAGVGHVGNPYIISDSEEDNK